MVDKNGVRRGYDDLASVYAADRPADDPGTEMLAQVLDELPEGSRVLDAGCGQGTPVLSRVRESATAVGVDFSRGQLRLAAENVPGVSLVQGDMAALPFADGAFDAVVAHWSLIHVPLADHQTVVDEFARVLRPGGRVLLSEGTSEWVGENPDWLGSGVAMEWNVAGPAATREQLRAAGFEVVETRDVPEPLDHDGDADGDDGSGSETEDGDESDDLPWRFFSARLDA